MDRGAVRLKQCVNDVCLNPQPMEKHAPKCSASSTVGNHHGTRHDAGLPSIPFTMSNPR